VKAKEEEAMDKDFRRNQDENLKQSDLNRSGSNQPNTGKIGTTHTEPTRRPSDTFQGSTGNISGDNVEREDSDLERERMSDREGNVEQ
jgi:hypothetical protein